MNIDQLAAETLLNIRAEAQHFAAQTGQAPSFVTAELIRLMGDMLPKSVSNENDKRSTAYRVRLTLFARGGLVADTDPELQPNHPGVEVVRGLAAVGEWAREIVELFHGEQVVGFDNTTIAKSVRSLRPSLSRNGGQHNWRFKYWVGQEECLANILVVTE